MGKVTLKSITTKIGSGATPTGGQKSYQDEGIPLIRSQNVLDFRFSRDGLAFINIRQASQLSNVTVEENDVLLNITGDSIARVCLVPKEILPARVNQHVSIIRTKKDVDSRYILYYLQYLKPYLFKICKVGGTRNALTKEVIEKLEIEISENHQKIAEVLTALDKKIELNKQISTKLEAITKTLYDYWFVQFDFPNEKGKPYKSSGGKMVWNATLKRDIPLGWKVKSLIDITKVNTDTINPMKFPEMEFKHYSIPTFDETGTYKIEYGEAIMSNKFTVRSSDLLVSKLNPWFNRVVYATNDNDLICSTEFVVWRTKNKSIKNYLYMIAKDAPFINYCTRSASGTSHSHRRVNPQVMMRYQVPYNDDVVNKFGPVVDSAIEMFARNSVESQTLTELRDWLLPLLMNSQVSIGN